MNLYNNKLLLLIIVMAINIVSKIINKYDINR